MVTASADNKTRSDDNLGGPKGKVCALPCPFPNGYGAKAPTPRGGHVLHGELSIHLLSFGMRAFGVNLTNPPMARQG
jgi:hypothetical protein